MVGKYASQETVAVNDCESISDEVRGITGIRKAPIFPDFDSRIKNLNFDKLKVPTFMKFDENFR